MMRGLMPMEPIAIPVLAHINSVIIPIVALLIPIVVVPTAMIVRLAQRSREMAHLERMKALEMGRDLSGETPGRTLARVASKIGAGVPAFSLGFALVASLVLDRRDAEMAWAAAGIIACSGVICGGMLALVSFKFLCQAQQAAHASYSGMARKPAFDPDAYDSVGSRG